jgi:hypothetical protein
MAKVFLPAVHGPALTGQSDATAEFVRLWFGVLGDKAQTMRHDDRLTACAADHATYLDSRSEEQIAALAGIPHAMHIGRDGQRSNARVRQFGYALRWWYPDDSNQVENCCRVNRGAASALQRWLDSAPHRMLLLGEGWYAEQNHIVWGIGTAGRDWVLLCCPPEGS